MASVTRICKICGKEYEYCKSKSTGAFIWKEVACCPEHAAQYFEKVAIARGEKSADKDPEHKPKHTTYTPRKSPSKKEIVIDNEDDDM